VRGYQNLTPRANRPRTPPFISESPRQASVARTIETVFGIVAAAATLALGRADLLHNILSKLRRARRNEEWDRGPKLSPVVETIGF